MRRAFAMAIDKSQISKTVFFGFYTPANSIVPPGIPGFYTGYKGLPYDPAAAKKLLDEAGVTGKLPPLHIAMNPAGPVAQMESEPVAAMLKQNLGVDVALDKTEFSNFIANANRRTVYAAFMSGWSADYLDYSDYLDFLLYSTSPINRVNYDSPQFDKLLDQANAAGTETQRLALYHQAEAFAVEEAPMVPMLFTRFAYLVKPYVKGIQTTPAVSGWLPFSGVAHREVGAGTGPGVRPDPGGDGAIRSLSDRDGGAAVPGCGAVDFSRRTPRAWRPRRDCVG